MSFERERVRARREHAKLESAVNRLTQIARHFYGDDTTLDIDIERGVRGNKAQLVVGNLSPKDSERVRSMGAGPNLVLASVSWRGTRPMNTTSAAIALLAKLERSMTGRPVLENPVMMGGAYTLNAKEVEREDRLTRRQASAGVNKILGI